MSLYTMTRSSIRGLLSGLVPPHRHRPGKRAAHRTGHHRLQPPLLPGLDHHPGADPARRGVLRQGRVLHHARPQGQGHEDLLRVRGLHPGAARGAGRLRGGARIPGRHPGSRRRHRDLPGRHPLPRRHALPRPHRRGLAGADHRRTGGPRGTDRHREAAAGRQRTASSRTTSPSPSASRCNSTTWAASTRCRSAAPQRTKLSTPSRS